MSQDTPQNLRPQDFHLTHPCFELCRSRSRISILYPTRVPTLNQCPKTHHKTSDPKIFISQIPVLNFAGTDLESPYYTPHVCQPILNQCPKTHHKTSDPKICISHIPFLNFAGADLHSIPHMCANPSWTNVPRQTTKPQTPRFSSHTSLFWTLPEQISILYPTCVATHPEPMSQDTPQNLRPQDVHLTHPCFELCRSRSPYYTPHVCQPILNQCPKTDHKTSDPKIFISHIPVLNFGADLHIIPHMCGNPSWTNVPRHTTKPQTPRFSSHTSLFRTLPEQISILYPTCVPTHPEPMSQDTPQNLRPQNFHLTHPCFELSQNRCRVWAPRSSKLIPWLFVDMIARVKNVKRKQGSCVPQRIEFNPRVPSFFICLIRTTSMPRCFHWISIT